VPTCLEAVGHNKSVFFPSVSTMPPASLLLKRVNGLVRFWVLSQLLRFVPLTLSYKIGRWHGRWTYRRRRASLEPHAFEMQRRLGASRAQVEEWLERHFELAASEKLDAHLYHRMGAEGIQRLIEIRGLEHLNSALERGSGAILYSGHVTGHFTFFVGLGLQGFPLNMIGFPEDLEQWTANRRNGFMERRLGFQFLRMHTANFGIAVKAANALRRNGIVTIEIDQTESRPKVEVEFMGGPGYFPTGAALIAQASGAPLLPFWINRPESWLPQIAEIGEPYYVSGDVTDAVRHCAAVLESSIVADPPSWHPWLFSRRLVWQDPPPATPDVGAESRRKRMSA
jgi:lauroyl/myristoyl acyltransferase